MRILIAEDDPAFGRLLHDILAKWGYQVVITRNGNDAWQALEAATDPPQLALLDWMMPGMNGVEICRRVREQAREPYVYLILLTSQQRDEDLVTGMDAGADDYLTKPLKINELRVRLNAGRRMVELQNELLAARETIAARAADLEAANRDLEAFGYAVSNDILQSLMAIGDYAKTIRQMHCGEKDEQCKSYTHRIYEKTKHLARLIGVMHDFFQPTKVELHKETLDLSEMAGKAAQHLRLTHPEKKVTFRIAEGLTASGDAPLLQVVMNNILDNAWKHTGKRPEPLIEFGMTKAAGETAYFVRDNGTGFDMEHAGRLFLPFQRLPGSEEFAGIGIGLATVERIIRRHGGKVWAEGKPDQGATFYFTL
jgi:two-component system, sensor histidine kinase and response regulator